ncbi:MAG: hypothetical protein HUU28_18545 [Planctomycetaceae bacterium]|nr:hypothetical protein [Planctomycetaceae bacterium]
MAKIQSDEHGRVIGFPYHDGDLEGVLCDGKTVHLALRSVGGERRVLSLRGVKHLAVDEFWLGNIVLVMFLSDLAQRCAGSDEFARQAAADWRIELGERSSGLLGFVLLSSYGATVRAVCDDAEVSEPGVTLSVAHAT